MLSFRGLFYDCQCLDHTASIHMIIGKKNQFGRIRKQAALACKGWGKQLETSVRTAGAPTEIRKKHFLNTSLKCHCYTNEHGLNTCFLI
jgi:hypothetical protein